MFTAVAAGLLTSFSLIVAIGAQNAYVLRQGVRREHVGPIVAICAASDLILIVAGVSGVGALVQHSGRLLDVVRWFGVAFLVWYALGALRRAWSHDALTAGGGEPDREELGPVVRRTVALTWLNPHVYLDTLLLLGSIAAVHDKDVSGGRWWFALGACIASTVWFIGLGFGARMLAPMLARPRAWQVLDVLVAATMIFVAVRLALG
ncbi:MAG TPA: LysE/ArgO family amino acid transporter [Marmoricola sp.]